MFIDRQLLSEIFAPVIWSCVEQYQGVVNNMRHTDPAKRILKQKLKTTINETLRYWEEEQPKMVSCGAINLADTFNKINGTTHDITKIKYPDRHIFGGTTGKPNLMFDHTTPVTETVQDLLKCCHLADVVIVLNTTSELCITTRAEDDLLNKKGYKRKRPGGWEKCYEVCGIKICYRPEK